MKYQLVTFIAIFVLISTCFNVSANKYEQIMQSNIDKMYKAQNAEELILVSGIFYRIAEKENQKWLPLYYAAYSLLRTSFFIKDEDKIDKNLDMAQAYVDKLLELKANESEVHVLQALVYSMRITSPARGMKYSSLSNGALDKAQELNEKNPRIYYCRGNNIFHTPAMFGGGKQKAKPLYEKAITLFNIKQDQNKFWPTWGIIHAKQMLNKCK